MIRVDIVDDHPLMIEGLKNLIETSGVAEMTDSAGTGKACLNMLQFSQPDVLLMDIHLPDTNGIDLCKEVHTRWPDIVAKRQSLAHRTQRAELWSSSIDLGAL